MKHVSCQLAVSDESMDLCELFLVVRPEDKADVVRVLEGELGSGFVIYPALGRGCEGGLAYGAAVSSKSWLTWVQRPMLMAFLPKIMLWAVIDRAIAKDLVEKVGAALRMSGGPSECAGGFAIIAEMQAEVRIGITPGSGKPVSGEKQELAPLFDREASLV